MSVFLVLGDKLAKMLDKKLLEHQRQGKRRYLMYLLCTMKHGR